MPWNIREETFKSHIQVMLDHCLSAVEGVRLKPEGGEEADSKVAELANRTMELTQEFCAMVERDFVSKVEEQKTSKEREASNMDQPETSRKPSGEPGVSPEDASPPWSQSPYCGKTLMAHGRPGSSGSMTKSV